MLDGGAATTVPKMRAVIRVRTLSIDRRERFEHQTPPGCHSAREVEPSADRSADCRALLAATETFHGKCLQGRR